MPVQSADKKPEKYIGPDGKPKIRMVPVDKNIRNEVSKGMIGRYLKKVPASAADAGRKSAGTTGIGPDDQKKNVEKGIRKFVNRQRGTSMAVDKMTGKAKVPARESVEVSEKHVYRFSTKTKQGNIHHSSKDDAGAKKAIEKRTGEKVQSMTYRGPASGMPTRREDSDAVKAFLAKGGKIKKLPPAKAQGYHGKDDPGKDVKGVMDRPDTKAMGTRKKVKSMEQTNEDPAFYKAIAKQQAADQAKRDAADPAAAARRKAAKANIAKRKPVTPDSVGRHSSQGGGFIGRRNEALNKDDKPFVKDLVGKLRKGSKTHAKQADDLEKAMKTEMKTFWDLRDELTESMLGHSDAEKLNGGKSRDPNFKSPESHIDHHHRQTGGHEKSGGDQDRHRYNVAKKLGYNV